MTDEALERLKYPIGRFLKPPRLAPELVTDNIADIEAFPERLGTEVLSLRDHQLDTAYRPGGWTIRQVVHHVADSHMNAYIRFKLALTEEKPTIKPYFEDRWAELVDGRTMPVEVSVNLLTAMHARWTVFLRSLSDGDIRRKLIHPEHGEELAIYELIADYSWHGSHHLAQVTNLKRQKGW